MSSELFAFGERSFGDLRNRTGSVSEFILPSTAVLSKNTSNEFSSEIIPFAIHPHFADCR
jgi:hypothetical protein